VAVPETAVNKYHCFVTGQDNVGAAWQGLHMEAKAQAACVQGLADGNLWPRVCALYRAHVFGPD
jgi:hypothetical protein